MAGKPRKVPAPKPVRRRPTLRLSGDPHTDPKAAGQVHGMGLAAVVYGSGMDQRLRAPFVGLDLRATGLVHVRDVMERMAPRDPAEEMLVAQLLTTHARVMHLSELANRQTNLGPVRTLNEYADRASNTYRRLMLALAEYRRPPRTGDSFTAIRQTNIAGQQVVQTHENRPPTNATNEQGCTPSPAKVPAALPADSGRPDVLAGLRRPREAVDQVHRPSDLRGQGPVADEREQARRTVRRGGGLPA